MVLEYLHVACMFIQRYQHVGCFRPLGDDAIIRTMIGFGHLRIYWGVCGVCRFTTFHCVVYWDCWAKMNLL
jgi:hypothetical protein